MKKSLLFMFSLLPIATLLSGCNVNSSSSDLSSVLTVSEAYTTISDDLGAFYLSLSDEGHEFLETIENDKASYFTFGEAFEGFSFYYAEKTEEEELLIITTGELRSGHSYGTIKGKGITVDGSEFELVVPITPAKVSASGLYFSSKEENVITLTLEGASFHSDISSEDILLSGGLEGLSISKIAHIDDEGEYAEEEEDYGPMYKTLELTITGEKGPEEYGYISVLDSGTTYNEDISTSFHLLEQGAMLLEEPYGYLTRDILYFAFSNLTINPAISASDISIEGAMEGTTINGVEILSSHEEYENVLIMDVSYPHSYYGYYENETGDYSSSFIFSETSNLEGVSFSVHVGAPMPDIETSYTYDSSTRRVNNVITFSNGFFRSDLSVTDFAYYDYYSSETPIAITEASFSMDEMLGEITFSCLLPETGLNENLAYLRVKDIFPIHYSDSEKVEYLDYSLLQYLA